MQIFNINTSELIYSVHLIKQFLNLMKPVPYIADNASTSAGGVKNNGYRCRARPRRL
jgi:hypothetical protein